MFLIFERFSSPKRQSWPVRPMLWPRFSCQYRSWLLAIKRQYKESPWRLLCDWLESCLPGFPLPCLAAPTHLSGLSHAQNSPNSVWRGARPRFDSQIWACDSALRWGWRRQTGPIWESNRGQAPPDRGFLNNGLRRSRAGFRRFKPTRSPFWSWGRPV